MGFKDILILFAKREKNRDWAVSWKNLELTERSVDLFLLAFRTEESAIFSWTIRRRIKRSKEPGVQSKNISLTLRDPQSTGETNE